MTIQASESSTVSVLSQLNDNIVVAPYKWFSLQNNVLDGSYHPIPSNGNSEIGWWGTSLSDANGNISSNPSITFSFSAANIGMIMLYGDDKLNEFPVDFDYTVKDASNNVLDSGSVTGNNQLACMTYLNRECINATSVTFTIKKVNKPNTVAKILEVQVGMMVSVVDDIKPKVTDVIGFIKVNLSDTDALLPKYSEFLDTDVAGRNKAVGYSKYTVSSPFVQSSVSKDGYITVPVDAKFYLPAGEYRVSFATDGIWVSTHDTSGSVADNPNVTIWLYRYVNPTDVQYTQPYLIPNTGQFVVAVDGYYLIRVNIYSDGVTLCTHKFWNFKVEAGTVITDWSPAPEDGWGRITAQSLDTDTLLTKIDDMLLLKNFASVDSILTKISEIMEETNYLTSTEDLTPKIDDITKLITNKLNDQDTLLPKITDIYKMITNELNDTDDIKVTIDDILEDLINVHSRMLQDCRQIFGKVEIQYTEPLLDGAITVTTPDDNRISRSEQLTNGIKQSKYKWFSLQENKLDGSYHTPDNDSEVGWWGNTVSNADGSFDVPQVLATSFAARGIMTLEFEADVEGNCYPVDFDFKLYQGDALAQTYQVRGNTKVNYSQSITPIGNITKLELVIYKLNRQSVCRILEFYSMVVQTYIGTDLMTIHLLEELAYEDNGIPLGAVSANEVDISLNNSDRRFDLNNMDSPLYGMLRKNRKVTIWLGVKVTDEIEWHQLGIYWTTGWKAPFSSITASLTARDKLELLRGSDFTESQLYQNYTLYQLYDLLFTSFGLKAEEYLIDTALQSIVIPYAWFERISYREALEQLTKCGPIKLYCDHNGIINVKMKTTSDIGVINADMDNFIIDFDFPNISTSIVNSVEVKINNLTPGTKHDIYKNTSVITVDANSSKDITCMYTDLPNINVDAPIMTMDTGLTITNTVNYVWGAIITVQNTTANPLNVSGIQIQGVTLDTTGKDSIIVEDTQAIQTEGRLKCDPIDNPFIQDSIYATQLANELLTIYNNQKADISMDTRGDIALGIGEDIKASTDYAKDSPYTIFRQNITWNGALEAQMDCKKL